MSARARILASCHPIFGHSPQFPVFLELTITNGDRFDGLGDCTLLFLFQLIICCVFHCQVEYFPIMMEDGKCLLDVIK